MKARTHNHMQEISGSVLLLLNNFEALKKMKSTDAELTKFCEELKIDTPF